MRQSRPTQKASASRSGRRSAAGRAAARRGLAPGALVYTGDAPDHSIAVSVLDYDADQCTEHAAARPEDLATWRESDTVTWVNLDGIHDIETVRMVCSGFDVHPLAVEDLLNPGSRAKVEDYGDAVFVLVNMVQRGAGTATLDVEQIAVVLGPTWVLSFQERPGDVLDPIRKRIRGGTGRIRRMGADYLLHAILDAIVDSTFVVLEGFDDVILALDEQALEGANEDLIRDVHRTRGTLGVLRRLAWPMRDVAAELRRSEGTLLRDGTAPFFRDLHDHTLQAVDIIDSYRDRITSALELHLALVSNRMNEVMRLLTIVSTLFIPLTFIAGIYGMNFQSMPELSWRWGYPAVWLLMIVVTGLLLGYFRRRRWM